jgi:hypothetical protein
LPGREQLQDKLHGDARASDDWLPSENFGVNGTRSDQGINPYSLSTPLSGNDLGID